MIDSPFQPIQGISTGGISPIIGADSGKSLFAEEEKGSKFENIFARYMKTANETLMTAKEYGDKIATGELKDLHTASIWGLKAEIMMKLTTQIAAKVSSACTTLFQMQL